MAGAAPSLTQQALRAYFYVVVWMAIRCGRAPASRSCVLWADLPPCVLSRGAAWPWFCSTSGFSPTRAFRSRWRSQCARLGV